MSSCVFMPFSLQSNKNILMPVSRYSYFVKEADDNNYLNGSRLNSNDQNLLMIKKKHCKRASYIPVLKIYY